MFNIDHMILYQTVNKNLKERNRNQSKKNLPTNMSPFTVLLVVSGLSLAAGNIGVPVLLFRDARYVCMLVWMLACTITTTSKEG